MIIQELNKDNAWKFSQEKDGVKLHTKEDK
jgi:hypothetical protein